MKMKMKMNPLGIRPNDHVTIAGLNQVGKTTLVRWLLDNNPQRIFLLDPLDQYPELGEFGTLASGAKRYYPVKESPSELEAIAKDLNRESNRNTTLFIEEAEGFLPQGKELLEWTSSLLRRGPNWGNGVVAVTRRIQDLTKKMFDRSSHVIYFQCGPQSWDYIGSMIGKDFVRKPLRSEYNKLAYGISTLPEYHFLHYNLRDNEKEIVTLRLGKTIKKIKVGGEHVQS